MARENGLTKQNEPLILKPPLCYEATKAGNVQFNKDLKTQLGAVLL